MQRDDDIGAETSGHETDLGGSKSGGDAGDKPHTAFGESAPGAGTGGIDAEDAKDSPAADAEGTPEDLKPGDRRTAGVDEDDAAEGEAPPGNR